MSSKGTPPTTLRLTEADRQKIGLIRDHFGLPSDAAAVRYAVQQIAHELPVRPARPKRSRP